MAKNRVFWGLFISIIAASPLCAANISFLVMETGRSPDGSNLQYPIIWENTLMDVFFEEGHIVSNSPIMRLEEKPSNGFPSEAEQDFENAKNGGMQYFIITVVDYSIPSVSMRLFNTNSQQMIREQKYPIQTFKNTKEELDNIRAAVMAMADKIN